VKLGVGLFGTEPVARMVELAQLAEELGFATAWIGDSQNLWRDAYVTLGAAAAATTSIGLGTGVTNAVTRHPSVLASAWTSLAELAPGRMRFAIGTGDSSLRSMGVAPQRVAELEESIRRLRALLAGEEVAGSRLQFALAEPIPLYVAAASPRALRLAGRAADGVVACVGVDPALVEAALRYVADGAREAGRNPADVRVVLWTAFAVADEADVARDLVRAFTASAAMAPLVGDLDEEREAIAAIRQRYSYAEHMVTDAEHRALVPDSLVARIALAGTPADCRRQVDEIARLPIDQLSLVPFGDRPATMRRLFTDVVQGGS